MCRTRQCCAAEFYRQAGKVVRLIRRSDGCGECLVVLCRTLATNGTTRSILYHGMTVNRRLNTHNHILLQVITTVTSSGSRVFCIQSIYIVISIAPIAPAPVEMEFIIAVIAVADETMPIAAIVVIGVITSYAGVHNRACSIEFCF